MNPNESPNVEKFALKEKIVGTDGYRVESSNVTELERETFLS